MVPDMYWFIPFLILLSAILIFNGYLLGVYVSERRFRRGEYTSYEKKVLNLAAERGFENARALYANASGEASADDGHDVEEGSILNAGSPDPAPTD